MIRLIGTVLLLFLGWSVNIFAETMSVEAQDEMVGIPGFFEFGREERNQFFTLDKALVQPREFSL